jgi:hypothetical protein
MVEADLRGWLPVMGVSLGEDQLTAYCRKPGRLSVPTLPLMEELRSTCRRISLPRGRFGMSRAAPSDNSMQGTVLRAVADAEALAARLRGRG